MKFDNSLWTVVRVLIIPYGQLYEFCTTFVWTMKFDNSLWTVHTVMKFEGVGVLRDDVPELRLGAERPRSPGLIAQSNDMSSSIYTYTYTYT